MLIIRANLNGFKKPKLKPFYKLRENKLLYPEGIVTLNDSAYKILKLCDGTNDINEIKENLCYGFEDPGEIKMVDNDIDELLNTAYLNNWVI